MLKKISNLSYGQSCGSVPIISYGSGSRIFEKNYGSVSRPNFTDLDLNSGKNTIQYQKVVKSSIKYFH